MKVKKFFINFYKNTEGVLQFVEAPPQYFYENKALFQNR